ncbi:MAG: two-component regulator propeller domain-containing protein [Bacteroidales bacterium]
MRSSYHILAVFLLCLLFPRLNASCFEAVKPLGDIGNIRAHSICQDNTGTIWISTNLGLFSYDGINTTIHPVSCEKYKHSSSLIHHLVYNPAENNLYMLLHGYLMSYNLVNGNSKELSTQPFYNLKQGKGRLLTSNQDSLFEYADNHISLLYTLPEKDIITAILEDENGIFLGTRNSGLLFLNKERQLTSFAPHFKEIISLFKDSDSNLWASSDGHGLMRFALQQGGSDHRQYTAESGSLLSNSVREVNEDNEKNLWVATSEGVNVFALSGTPIRGYSKRSDTRTGLTE